MTLRRAAGTAVLVLAAGLAGCSAKAAGQPGSPVADRAGARPSVSTPVEPAREGSPAPSSRVRFVPEQVILPGGARAAVVPASTVDGELQVPQEVTHVGWWDGSAYAGDPFGSTVIAGHVDSRTEGVGFFARLLRVRVGDTVTLLAGRHQLSYRVRSLQTITKGALATDSAPFAQTGDARLVLITCGGAYHRDRGGYDSNVVVTAEPLGLAR